MAVALMMGLALSSCGKKEVTCNMCNGTGEIPMYQSAGTCVQCNGTGIDPRTNDMCGSCFGKGEYQVVVERKTCEQCGGTGLIEE